MYRLTIRAEVPDTVNPGDLAQALDDAGAAIGIDVQLDAP